MTTSPDLKFLLAHPAHAIALGFGSGLARKAPGTFGTLVAFPIHFLMPANGMEWPLLLLFFLGGVHVCAVTGKHLGADDHGSIVWDEVVAFMLVLRFTPPSAIHWLAAFILFRLFDIWKPFPIRQLDAKLKGGFGVMFDDLLAAIYTIGTMMVLQWLTIRF